MHFILTDEPTEVNKSASLAESEIVWYAHRMSKFNFFIAGRWRNRENIIPVLEAVRREGETAYCFIENLYEGEKVEFSLQGDIEQIMKSLESLPMDDPFVRKIFTTDINAERESDNFLLVLPAGISGHVEAGAAYGIRQEVLRK